MRKPVVQNRSCLLVLLAVLSLLPGIPAWGGENPPAHIAVLSDLHLPGRNKAMKQKVAGDLNSWNGLTMTVGLGDICSDTGTAGEYEFARKFLSGLKAPFYPVAGNHDYIYEDSKTAAGRRVKATPAVRKEKLERFKASFSLPDVRYARKAAPYLLLFLSTDDLESKYLAQISDESLSWMEKELGANRGAPTVVFFHAPLRGTLMSENRSTEREDFVAQPEARIRAIIRANPQIFLWVSGHTHIAPTNRKYSHPVNVYEKQVTNIHNCDLNGQSYLLEDDPGTTQHENAWTNSLFLHGDKVVVKTYDHRQERWMEKLNREIFWKR
jgi:predicted MPP superfamily phosphohydrolase